MQYDLRAIGRVFSIPGSFAAQEIIKSGHIHDTYMAMYRCNGKRVPYVHQRMNSEVFSDPVSLMSNIEKVTLHLRQKFAAAGENDINRRVLTVVPTRDGAAFYRDPLGECWRTYLFIEGSETHDVAESATQAYEAARAFGLFQGMLADLAAPRLAETIPDFHNTPKRLEALESAIETDVCGHAGSAIREIEFALARKEMASLLMNLHGKGEIPERITHNDTKINNVLMDRATGKGLCVIDLDTVMPGLALYDFGDMVRTSVSPAAEDERDLSKVCVRMPIFDALVSGYLSTAGGFLNDTEKEYLTFSGKLITLEIGVRFLADHLAGNVYFKVHREGHNLDRCRTQFRLVQEIERQEDEMNRIVERTARGIKAR